MRVHVAYVIYEGANLGSHVLGVTTNIQNGKMKCQEHAEFHGREPDQPLVWDHYSGSDGTGIQAIHQDKECYYIEETELEVQTREGDPETGLSYDGRQVINLTIANGDLAQKLLRAQKNLADLDIPLCSGHAETWYCERNHLTGGMNAVCVVCAHLPPPRDKTEVTVIP